MGSSYVDFFDERLPGTRGERGRSSDPLPGLGRRFDTGVPGAQPDEVSNWEEQMLSGQPAVEVPRDD